MEQVTCYYQIAKDHIVYIAVIRVASSLSFSVALAICEPRIGIGSVILQNVHCHMFQVGLANRTYSLHCGSASQRCVIRILY